MEKLKQVNAFKDLLLQHQTKKFAEATMHPFYGIGLSLAMVRKKGQSASWKGENAMGDLITNIAATL